MMSIAIADELFDKAFEAIKQLFREVGRKGAPEHSELLNFVRTKHYQLHRIILEQTSDQHRVIAAVDALVDDTIKAESKKGTNPNTVASVLVESRKFQQALVAAAPQLAEKAVLRNIRTKLHRCKTTTAKAEQDAKWHDSAPFLDFPNIEQFKDLPKMIEYIVPAKGKQSAYRDLIDYKYSTSAQRESSLKLQRDKNDKNKEAYDREFQANEILKPLVQKYGEHPPPILWAKKIQDEKRKPKASGD